MGEDMPGTMIELQRRMREIGRIKLGVQVPTSKGGSRPSALDTFRFTSSDTRALATIAELWGGEVADWNESPIDGRYQVLTTSSEIDVLVLPRSITQLAQSYELWSGGGCKRRCDGRHDQITDQPCECDPENRECKLTTRLSVMLADVPGFGVWRLESHGYYAAVELPAPAEMLATLAEHGDMVPAVLRLERREVKRPGEPTKQFVVPALDAKLTPRALMGAVLTRTPIGNGASRLVELPAPSDDEGIAEPFDPAAAASVFAPSSGDLFRAAPEPTRTTSIRAPRQQPARPLHLVDDGSSGNPPQPPPNAPSRAQSPPSSADSPESGGAILASEGAPERPQLVLITSEQRKALNATLRDVGIEPARRDERLTFASAVVGRPLSSANDLTMSEASRLLDLLHEVEKGAARIFLDDNLVPIGVRFEDGRPSIPAALEPPSDESPEEPF